MSGDRPSASPRPNRLAPALVAAIVGSTACVAPEEGPPGFTVVDSAGVSIATSTAPRWEEGEGIHLAEAPSVVIGAETDDEAYLLGAVAGGGQLEDGTLVLCDSGDRTIRYFSAIGEHLRTVGGRGAGPGELRNLIRCFVVGNTVWVYQAPALPIERFDGEGNYLDAVPMPLPGGRPAVLMDIGADGSLVVRQEAPRRDLPSGVALLPASIFRVSEGGEPELVADLPGGRWVRGSRTTFPAAFSPTAVAAWTPSAVLVAWPADWELRFIEDGGAVSRLVRLDRDLVGVTGGHRSAFELRVMQGPMPSGDMPYRDAGVRAEIVDIMVYPEVLPAFYRVFTTRGGTLWVEQGDAPRDPLPWVADPYDAPTVWDVIAPEGAWLGSVTLPALFDPFAVGEDHVLGVQFDEFGVEQVHLYELIGG